MGRDCIQVVKGYPEGKMSKHIVELEPGDTLECKGPVPKLPYKANMKKSLGMVRPHITGQAGPAAKPTTRFCSC